VEKFEGSMDKIICYCFKYSQSDIEKDIQLNNGESRILEDIISKKQTGSCHCAIEHPKGR